MSYWPGGFPQGVSQAIHMELARASSALLAVQLDDALGALDAQNLPGTIDEHPNWRRRLALPVEDFDDSGEIQSIDASMPKSRRKQTQDC